ncbi:MAG TPA: DNA polymerase III subunit delta [Dissulfurispiraceae bacterium]|nr:DNA polymerase III subunit delta [Dissulfurispiraceae bacterium]
MSLKQFQQESERGFPSPVYLLHSSESFLLYEALTVLNDLFLDPASFNFETIDMASSDEKLPAEKIVDILNTLPFLANRKTVVLRNIQKLSKKEAQKFGAYMKAPAPSSLLILLFEGASPDIFDPAIAKAVKTIALNVSEREIPVWIRERAAKKGISFTSAAIEYIIGVAGTDLGMLHSEIEKFSSSETSRTIDVEEVRGVVYAGAEYGAFDLANALVRKDARSVFKIYENISKTMEPQMLLGALNWQYSSSYAKAGMPGGDRHKQERIFARLHEADMAVKTSHSHVMENLLVDLLKL